MLPAFVLLLIAALGIYLSITERNSSPILQAKKNATTSRPAKKTTSKKTTSRTTSARKTSAARKK
jgi:topoisomerase IA-like protein